MSAELHHLIIQYGYWLMLFGALIEGETFLFAGGVAAQQGLLHLPGLIALALIGSLIHDNSFFLLGRWGGTRVLSKFPNFEAKSARILLLLDRIGPWLIIGLRFAYGFRTLIPSVLGMSPINFKRFLIFDIIGGVIWSCVFILGGYWLGGMVMQFFHEINHWQKWGYRGLAVAIVAVVIYLIIKRLIRRISS